MTDEQIQAGFDELERQRKDQKSERAAPLTTCEGAQPNSHEITPWIGELKDCACKRDIVFSTRSPVHPPLSPTGDFAA